MNSLEIKRSIEKLEQMVNEIQAFIPANAVVALKQEIQKVHNAIGLHGSWAVVTLDDIKSCGFDPTGISEEQLQDIIDNMASDSMSDQYWYSLSYSLEEEGVPKRPQETRQLNVTDNSGNTLVIEVSIANGDN